MATKNKNHTSSSVKIGGKYRVFIPLGGYYTSVDAMQGKSRRTTVKAGTYYVYNIGKNGAINVTTKKNSRGFWINPDKNKKGNTTNKTTSNKRNKTVKPSNTNSLSGKSHKPGNKGITTIAGPYSIDKVECYILNLLTNTKIEFELPDDLSDSVSANFDDATIRGRSSTIKGYDSSGPRSVSFSIQLSDDLCSKGLAQTIAYLRAFSYPNYSGQVDAPKCYIRIGKAIKGIFVIGSVGVNYQKPYRNGNYISAEVSLDLTEASDTVYSAKDIEKGSGMW